MRFNRSVDYTFNPGTPNVIIAVYFSFVKHYLKKVYILDKVLYSMYNKGYDFTSYKKTNRKTREFP